MDGTHNCERQGASRRFIAVHRWLAPRRSGITGQGLEQRCGNQFSPAACLQSPNYHSLPGMATGSGS